MKSHCTVVIFDMDGVITDTMPYHYKVWRKIFHDAGIPVTKFEVYSREGQTGIKSVFEIFAKYQKPITLHGARRLLAKKEMLFKRIVQTRFITGARTFIKRCHQNGYRLALVTGTSRHEVLKVLPSHLMDCFEVIISGSDVKNGKPHPEPYLKAIRALKIKKTAAVVIENAPFGITSAKKAGLCCFALTTSLPKKYLKEADKIFSDFHKLEGYFYGRRCNIKKT